MSILDNVKEVADLVKKVGDVELYRKIVELEGEVVELTRSKRALELKVEELEGLLSFSKKLMFKNHFYFAEGDEVPYCARCWELRKQAVHLFVEPWSVAGQRLGGHRYSCSCGAIFVLDH
jgi:DNA integrity scanning protein DisA with diadenylate cyclase activity